ncbi:hypothetical protein KFU94_65895 [Chloroflexi bacterium TSY]|nr:hypothetical protein [Chloroflexi bacterium TSY]
MNNQSSPTPYPLDELHDKWQLEQISTERAVGQLIVWAQLHEARLVALLRELEDIARSVADLDARLQGVEGGMGIQIDGSSDDWVNPVEFESLSLQYQR